MSQNAAHILVTGGAGFIGSHFVKFTLEKYADCRVTVLDKLTYAGNLENLREVDSDPRYRFLRGDICDAVAVDQAMAGIDAVVNFAAETHVDRSLLDPGSFILTDVYGTHVLLEAAKKHAIARFVQISTDEVYGPIEDGSAREDDPLRPSSPYSAGKVGGDVMASAYHRSFGLPVMITRGCNTYGSNQYPEKLIPLFITNALDDQPLPIYGDGLQIREWIHARDHCAAVDCVLRLGVPGEIYNVGTGESRTNLSVTEQILRLLGKPRDLLRPVADRPGHDRRYSVDSTKLRALGWSPKTDFAPGIEGTVRWYKDNESWWRPIKSGEYLDYYRRNYAARY